MGLGVIVRWGRQFFSLLQVWILVVEILAENWRLASILQLGRGE